MTLKNTARSLLVLESASARALFQEFTPLECAGCIEEIFFFIENPLPCLVGPSIKNAALSPRPILRELFRDFPYSKELQVYKALDARDPELAEEVRKALPHVSFLHFLNDASKSSLFAQLDSMTLLHLRALFVHPRADESDANEARNFRILFDDLLDPEKLAEVQSLLPDCDHCIADNEATTAVSRFRNAIYAIEGSFGQLYGRTGGHPDPEVTTLAFRAVVIPDGNSFTATLPDVPELVFKGATMKIALKGIGDLLASHMVRLLQAGRSLPQSQAASTHIAIAVRGKTAWNHWHPTIDHIAEQID